MKVFTRSVILALVVVVVLPTTYGFQLQMSFGGDKKKSESAPFNPNSSPAMTCSDGTPPDAMGKCADGMAPQPLPPAEQNTTPASTISGYPSDWVCSDGTPLTALVDFGGGPGDLKCANGTLPQAPGEAPPAGQNTKPASTDATALSVRCFGDLKRALGLIAVMTQPGSTDLEKANHVASLGISLADNVCIPLTQNPQDPAVITQLEQMETQIASSVPRTPS